jgi:hypothetical protein
MDEAAELELVRKAVTSRVGGCCEWDYAAANRVRSDRNLEGLSPESIKELLEDYVTDHPDAVTARREKGDEARGTDFWFRVLIPVKKFTHGLFVKLILVDLDPEVPIVWIVSVHEQQH